MASSEHQPGDVIRRRAYLAVLALVALLLTGLVVAGEADDAFQQVVFPSTVVFCVGVFVALWRRWISLNKSETLLLVPPVVVLLGYLATWRLAPGRVPGGPDDLAPTMMWVWVTFPLSFLALGTRRGLQVCIAIYVVFLLLVAPPAVGGQLEGGRGGVLTTMVWSLAPIFAISIALLWVLASRLEQFAAAQRRSERFATEAGEDALTGLANRRRLDDELDRQIARSRRQGSPLSAIMADLDHFKQINDAFGHEAGDVVLREAADRFAGSVRAGDLVGRWGGEEFLIIAADADNEAARVLAERCRESVGSRPFPRIGTVTSSFGVSTLGPEDDRRSLLRRADLALYAAKSEGRDLVVGMPDADARDLALPTEHNGDGTGG